MRLVLVHGRGQGESSEQQQRDVWLPALRTGIEAAGGPPIADAVSIRMPFYGAELDRLVDTPPPGEFVTRGAGGVPNAVEAELLLALAEREGITEAEIAAGTPAGYTERGLLNVEWVQSAAGRLVERVPWLSELALKRFVRDVGAYLTRDDVRKAVHDLVAPEIEGDTAIVVGHSLGSVVTYATLTELGEHARVPLFVTVGSPLGIPVVKKYLPRPLGLPRGVTRWLNGTDERDFVALKSRLDRDTFPAEIENVSDVHNPRENAHGIAGYLSDKVIARRIAEALAH